MLIGEYTNSVTSGNRTALPKKLREVLGEKLIVTRGYEGCLILVSHDQWDQMIKEAASGPFVSGAVRDTSRFLLGGAHEIELDEQGRFVLPKALIEYSGINEKVTFLGLNRWVEIWDEEKWRQRKDYIDQHGSEIAESLAKVDLD